jgi:hypothetical protein
VREPDEEDPLSVDYTEYDSTARVHNPYEEDSCGLTITHPERAQEALHAALLVLAGELDLAAAQAAQTTLAEVRAAVFGMRGQPSITMYRRLSGLLGRVP